MKENSIEEITFVENKIKNTRRVFEEVGCHVFFDEDLCKAIEHILSDYKKVLEDKKLFKHRLEVADEFIESRKHNLIPEHYDDLKYILNECDLDSTW